MINAGKPPIIEADIGEFGPAPLNPHIRKYDFGLRRGE
jgi:hypothetical protein